MQNNVSNKNDLLAVLQVLKKYNLKVKQVESHENYFLFTFFNFFLKGTENILKQEANLTDVPESFPHDASDSVLQAYQSEGDPNSYESCYFELRKFVDSALDIYKVFFREIFLDLFLILVFPFSLNFR